MADKALLLGINQYKKVNSLRGCVNDVENMRKLLIDELGFSQPNVKVLVDQRVLKSEVKKQMKWLFKDAQPEDRIVFHFSGHGSYTADLDGDEEDAADELICLYDMDFNDSDTYLLDDELRRWTENLPPGAQLTIVLDSCHSGTGTRLVMAPVSSDPHKLVPMRIDDQTTLARAFASSALASRGPAVVAVAAAAALDPNHNDVVRIRFIDPPPAIKAEVERRRQPASRGLVVAQMNHVLLAACRSDQTAADATIGGAPNGAFTYYLCQTLRTAGSGMERKELIDRVERALRDGHFGQVPQLEGPVAKGPLFGSRSATTGPDSTGNSSSPGENSPTGPDGSNAEGDAMTASNSLSDLKQLLPEIARLTPEAQLEALRMVRPLLGASRFIAPSRAVGRRYLIYVHGICQHLPGYSNGWWDTLKPFTNVFEAGSLNDTRREVVWSDLVNERALALQAARDRDPRAAQRAVEQVRAEAEIREALQDRVDRHAVDGNPQTAPGEAPRALTEDRGLISIPGLNCVDDFTVYLVNDETRAQVLERFTRVVQPLLQEGAALDIISHSWGTVVAYEGLRELELQGLTTGNVRNFFTVGAALSIGPVKMRLRPANRDGRRPAMVQRWINLNAHGDVVGGPLQNRPYQVDNDFPNLVPFQCGSFFGFVKPACAHGSYFVAGNTAVNRDVFANFIN